MTSLHSTGASPSSSHPDVRRSRDQAPKYGDFIELNHVVAERRARVLPNPVPESLRWPRRVHTPNRSASGSYREDFLLDIERDGRYPSSARGPLQSRIPLQKHGEHVQLRQVDEFSAMPRSGAAPGSLRRPTSVYMPNRFASGSHCSESPLQIDPEGRVWWSMPVGGDYHDDDIDASGRVRWQGSGRAWETLDDGSSSSERSFFTTPET